MEFLSCELCGVASYSENLHMQHIFSRKHIQCSRNAVSVDHSIHVTGFTFHTNMKDLYEHFSKYGRIKFIDMIQGQGRKKKPNFAFVEFENPTSVEAALLARHHVNGRIIYVNRRQKPIAKEEPIDLEKLQKCSSVQEQIHALYTMQQLTDADREKREKLRAMIEAELKQYFPNCSAHIFGSSVNSFGCKGCDVDVLLETNVETSVEDDSDESRKPPDIPTVNQIKNGDVSLEVLNKLTKNGQLQFIRRALLHQREEYISVVYIPASICPIVKFLSKTHSLRCDLSNGTSLPLHNTALLQLYAKLDPRVSPLMTVLRRWAKANANDYIGTQPFSSYCFSLMVIFFLQTRSPHVLPSVNFLRSKTNVKTIIDGYDCSFCSDVSKLERSKNKDSLEKLMLDFFVYYKDFDFFENAICPLTGNCEPKMKFDPAQNPDMGKFKVSHICIQDPFETTRNCAANVKFQFLLSMVDHFKRVVEEFRFKPESDDATSKTWGVAQLLGASSKRGQRQDFRRSSFSFNIVMSQKMLKNLRDEFNVDESQNALLSQIWVYDVTNIILDVLRHVMLLECEIVDAVGNNWYSRKRKTTPEDDESTPCKVARTDGVSSISDNRGMSVSCSVNGNLPSAKKGVPVSYQNSGRRTPDIRNMTHFAEFVAHSKNATEEPFLCAQVTAYHKTWINRNLPTTELINTGLENVLESERAVSLQLVNDAKVKLKNEGKFFCEFYNSRKAGYTVLDIKVDPFGMDRSNLQLFKFLKMFMRQIVEF